MWTPRDLLKLANAAIDYRYLLDRGYPQKPSLDLVMARYSLSSESKLALYRCVHTSVLSDMVRAKMVWPRKLSKYDGIVVDFYNVTLTALAAYLGQPLFLCDDCLVRDVRGSKVRSSEREAFMQIIRTLADLLLCLGLKRVVIVADKRVSWSAEHVSYLRKLLENRGVSVEAMLSDRTDSRVILRANSELYPIASTDIVIIERARAVVPLANILCARLGAKPLFDFASLFNTPCDNALSYSESCVES